MQARPTKLFRTEDSPGMSSTPSANAPRPGNLSTALFPAGKQVHSSSFFSPSYAFSSVPNYPPMVPQSAIGYGRNINVSSRYMYPRYPQPNFGAYSSFQQGSMPAHGSWLSSPLSTVAQMYGVQQQQGPYFSTITPTNTHSNVPNMEQGDIDMFFKRHKWVKVWGRTSDSLPKGDKGKSPKVQNIPKIEGEDMQFKNAKPCALCQHYKQHSQSNGLAMDMQVVSINTPLICKECKVFLHKECSPMYHTFLSKERVDLKAWHDRRSGV